MLKKNNQFPKQIEQADQSGFLECIQLEGKCASLLNVGKNLERKPQILTKYNVEEGSMFKQKI